MSTPSRYLELIDQHPLRPIRSDAELRQAITVMNSLLAIEARSRDESDYLEVLGTLIKNHDGEQDPSEPRSQGDMLRFLLESKGLTQAQLSAATKVPESTISSVLGGKRGISKANVAALARFFGVSPFVFLGE